MNHYFFKFGKANDFFKESNNIQNDSLAPLSLSIFFNKYKSWTVEDYYVDKRAVNRGEDSGQISTFFDAANNRDTVFWLFFEDFIYALIPQSEVYNGTITEAMDKAEYGQPKAVNVTIFKKIDKKGLPEAFASINSYQKYNRRTIVKLEKEEEEIAEWVYTHSDSICKMLIIKDRRFFYLSPLQFETLIFLIFHHNNIFCTTYRGGTLEGVDFKLRTQKEVSIEGMQLNDNIYVQVKKDNCPHLPLKNGIILVHLGKSFPDKHIYGLDWIEFCLRKLPGVENWLIVSLDFFSVV